MSAELVIGSIDRAGDHAAVMGVVFAVVIVGGLLYGVVRLAVKSRAARSRTAPRIESHRRPDA